MDVPTEGLRLEITLRPDGALHVAGAVADKLVAVGMLELAKQAVLQAEPPPQRRPGLLVPNGVLPFAGRR